MSRIPGDPEGEAPDEPIDAAARLRGRVARTLAELLDDPALQSPARQSNGDDSVSFHHGGAPCAVRVAGLADGLEVISMTCVLAWDVPDDAALAEGLADARGRVQFGSIRRVGRGSVADVVLQYSFPGSGLDDDPLRTMLLLVLGGVSDARAALAPADD